MTSQKDVVFEDLLDILINVKEFIIFFLAPHRHNQYFADFINLIFL